MPELPAMTSAAERAAGPASEIPPTAAQVLARIAEDSRRQGFEYFRAWEIPGGGE